MTEVLEVEDPTLSMVEQNIEINSVGATNYKPRQKIQINIPPSVGFINPAESYLTFDVEHSGKSYNMCNSMAGGHGYIEQLLIKNNTGETLESIDNYNFLVSHLLWRTRESKDHRNLQDLALGCENADFSPAAYDMSGVQPFYHQDKSKARGSGQITSKKVKMNINLMSGLLGGLGRNNIAPIMALGGLNIELNLASVEQSAFPMSSRVQDSASNPTRSAGDLVSQTENLLGDDMTLSGTSWDKITFSTFMNTEDDYNGMVNFPLKVGQLIFVDYKVNGGATQQHQTHVKSITRKDTTFETELEFETPKTLVDQDDITDIQVIGSVENATDWTISNVKMVVQVVAPTKKQLETFRKGISEGGGRSWRYYSITNYKYNVNSSQTQASLRIPVVNSRCLSLLSIPQNLSEINHNHVYGFLKNGEDGELDYQYMIKTRLVPDRKVKCQRDDDELKNGEYKVAQRELEKCLNVGGLTVKRLDTSNLDTSNEGLSSPFCIGRAVGSLRTTADLRNTMPTLNINYSSKNIDQLYNNFVFHTRRAVFTKAGLVIEY